MVWAGIFLIGVCAVAAAWVFEVPPFGVVRDHLRAQDARRRVNQVIRDARILQHTPYAPRTLQRPEPSRRPEVLGWAAMAVSGVAGLGCLAAALIPVSAADPTSTSATSATAGTSRAPEPTPFSAVTTNTTTELRIRSAPNTASDVLGYLEPASSVSVTCRVDSETVGRDGATWSDWYLLADPPDQRWVSGAYLEVDGIPPTC